MLRPLLFAVALCASACGPSTGSQPAETPPSEPGATEEPRGAREGDAPEISRSLGEQGGTVVFWPRIIPKSDDAAIVELAAKLQTRLTDVARKAGGPMDVRPEPERVCPRDGCVAKTLGVLLLHKDGGCTALALVSAPGEAPTRIVPWAGVVELKADTVPFRDPPENQVTVRDAVPCKDLVDRLGEHEADVVSALQGS